MVTPLPLSTPFHASFVINNPVAQDRLIDRMFDEFKILNKEGDNGLIWSDSSSFRDFIMDNYNKICDKYKCDGVLFYLKTSNRKVGVCAAPVKM